MSEETRISNAEYAKNNSHFLMCCEKSNTKPTPRQAGKFRNKYGAAYLVHREIAAGNKHKAVVNG